jgi:hypothetical protein
MTDDDDEDRDERATRIIRESRKIVEQHKRETREKRDALEKQSPEDVARTLLPLSDDPVERWKREADIAAWEREAAKADIASASARSALYDIAAVDRRIEMWLSIERVDVAEAIGTEIAKLLDEEREAVMRVLKDELRELKIEIAKYSSESAELRRELALDRSKPLDLPPLPRRSVN